MRIPSSQIIRNGKLRWASRCQFVISLSRHDRGVEAYKASCLDLLARSAAADTGWLTDRGCYSDRFSSARWTAVEILLLASFNRFLLRSSQECCQKPARRCEGQPQPRNGTIPSEMNQVGADCGRKATENGGGQTVGK